MHRYLNCEPVTGARTEAVINNAVYRAWTRREALFFYNHLHFKTFLKYLTLLF